MNQQSRWTLPRRTTLLCALGLLVLLGAGCDWLRVRVSMRNGNQLFNERKYDEAIVEYAKILRVVPDHWEANYYTATAYMSLYHPGSTHPKDLEYVDKAIAAFKRCLEIGPPNAEELEKIRNFYLGLLSSAGRNDQAAEFMVGMLAEDPHNGNLVTSLARLYASQGDFANALKYFELRCELEPDNKEAWYTVGVVCWERSYKGATFISSDERGQVIDRGIAALDRALQIDPAYFDALSYINLLWREKSQWLVQLGKYDEAQQAFQMAEQFKAKAVEVRDQQRPAQAAAGT
jgi:tetratricopeptide (TPR) repeat protein